MIKKVLGSLLDSNEKQLKKLQPLVDEINGLESEMKKSSDQELKSKTSEFKKRLGENASPEDLDKVLPEAYAVVREAAQRTITERPYDVQLMAAIGLHQGKAVEQKTGEGKTLSATMPLCLNALTGKSCHLVTVNDYLARRDCEWMGNIYHALGLSVASIQHEKSFIYEPQVKAIRSDQCHGENLKEISRREAYLADITYGTNNEFGFDYLRDNMVWDAARMVQRGHHYAIVDEVDSILIDEARTPLIISAPAEESTEKYFKISSLVDKLVKHTDYDVDEKHKSATLTEIGINKLERMLGVDNLYEQDFETVHHVEQALKAKTLFQKNRDYIVKESEVIIVDEFTGRLMPGRRYSEGLHQAIEAKEGVPIKRESRTLATISFQNYFRMYQKLAGMSATIATEAEEFAKIYALETAVVPTHKPMIRKDYPDLVFKTETAKWRAVVNEIEEKHKRGQPVLVGTTSIEKNELLHKFLQRRKVPHEILNAKQHEREATILAKGGQKGAVTVATNMAGRGVDIKLGEGVLELGGLHVIGTERHESRRIDNQLRGRSGRQGDSGSSRFFVSLQDDLMRIFGGEQVARVMDMFRMEEDMPIEHKMVSKSIETAQKRVEGHNFDIRKHLVEYDDVMNKQREIIYKMRNRILQKTEYRKQNTEEGDFKDWLLEKLRPVEESIDKIWEEKAGAIGEEVWERGVRRICLQVIDTLWIEHLDTMDDLREGISLRGYAQKDPLVEYKREGREMFEKLVGDIYATIGDRLSKVEIQTRAPEAVQQQPRRIQVIHPQAQSPAQKVTKQATIKRAGEKLGRNDPCPCGSGKKWKKCHYPEIP